MKDMEVDFFQVSANGSVSTYQCDYWYDDDYGQPQLAEFTVTVDWLKRRMTFSRAKEEGNEHELVTAFAGAMGTLPGWKEKFYPNEPKPDPNEQG